MINGFDSIGACCRFAGAARFWRTQQGEGNFAYEKNTIEKVGDFLTRPILGSVDRTLRHIREPLVVTAFTVAAIAGATVLFYPDNCAEFITKVFPAVTKIEPWMVKFGMFAISETFIFGFGSRTLGRLTNPTLMNAWRQREIIPVPIGSIMIPRAQ